MLMDFVDVDSDKWTQYAAFTRFPFSAIYRREGRTSAGIRAEGLREGLPAYLVTTEREAQLVRGISPGAPCPRDSEWRRHELFQPASCVRPPPGAGGDLHRRYELLSRTKKR